MSETKFSPPRHWVGPEELEPAYWSDPKVLEKRAQEFHDKPVELIERIDRLDKAGLARRDFLTIMGASMAMASFACARRPVNKIIPYVVKPEEITPGVATWYASTCKECASGCGILIKNREGRPIKIEGNPDHPMNRGKLCAEGQASVLSLYDPERLKGPLSLNRGGAAGRKEITWADADASIGQRLRALGTSGRVRILSGSISSATTRKLISEFLGALKGTLVEYDPLGAEEISEAGAKCYGTPIIPHHRFDQAETVVSLGADFLGTWISPVEHAVDWSKRRKLTDKKAELSKFYCFEPTLTVTGANADERFPIRPDDELKIALAIAHEIIVSKNLSHFAGNSNLASALNGYSSDNVSKDTGVPIEKIKSIARELWESRGKSLVVGGGIQSRTPHAVALQVAINLLNSALQNEGATVDGIALASESLSNFTAFTRLIEDMKSGQVDVLIIYRSNPIYTLPKSIGFEQALAKVPMVVSISDREDETAVLGDFVLPDHHYLENWGDSNPRKGLFSLQQPALAPIHNTRAFEDSLLVWVKRAGLNTGGIAARTEDWHEYLKATWRDSVYRLSSGASNGNFERFLEGALRDGVFDAHSAQGAANPASQARSFKTEALAVLPRFEANPQSFVLASYPKISLGDGRSANNAWLQEMPDPITGITWDNYLNIAPQTAKKLGIKENDVVEVNSEGMSAELPVHVLPGLHPNVVSAAVGYGRTQVGKVGNGAGVNVYPFAQSKGGLLAYSGQEVTLKKTGRFYALANTQWHTVTEDRPIINDITLEEYHANPGKANLTDPPLRMETVPTIWPTHEYKGNRWGMAIDLTSCIGCGSCVIACQAENNVPVVGRDQVRVSRQMHWIRIDRYFSGTAENPDVLFQPMLCQHCENASCETVCPVLATVHDDEGLNVQVYNRCVGTRYCQNNCPYKVRRFNFFDHWKAYEGTMNMVWNPDVTVRSRGIMEKCTFCVQRIREAKDHAKDLGRKIDLNRAPEILDGEIQTACQQTCPTDAIVFGNVNDPKSRVSKLRAEQRAFRALENLNNKPMISYLSKVRNKPHSGEHGAEHTRSPIGGSTHV